MVQLKFTLLRAPSSDVPVVVRCQPNIGSHSNRVDKDVLLDVGRKCSFFFHLNTFIYIFAPKVWKEPITGDHNNFIFVNTSISIFQNSAVNMRPQHVAPGNKIQCLWGLFPGASCWSAWLLAAEFHSLSRHINEVKMTFVVWATWELSILSFHLQAAHTH